jgi:hypothetical protein
MLSGRSDGNIGYSFFSFECYLDMMKQLSHNIQMAAAKSNRVEHPQALVESEIIVLCTALYILIP